MPANILAPRGHLNRMPFKGLTAGRGGISKFHNLDAGIWKTCKVSGTPVRVVGGLPFYA